jgi:lactate dehydrogenase-like 2-hydroxyacid dehydrogenase
MVRRPVKGKWLLFEKSGAKTFVTLGQGRCRCKRPWHREFGKHDMTKRANILSFGQITPHVDNALMQRFNVYRDDLLDLETILAARGSEIDAIVTRGRMPATAALMDRLPNLELIANFGVGYDSIDVTAAAERGIVVTNTPNVLDDEVADFTVGLLMATIRRFPQADQHVRTGRWSNGENFPLGASLRNRRIGIVGMGRIGRVIAKRLDGFDVPIAYHSRRPRTDLRYPYFAELQALAADVDTLIVVLPGGAATKGIINEQVLAELGPNGILINVARGSVVDETALIEALKSGAILAAGLDVFQNEPKISTALLELENTVLLPHIGAATHHTRGLVGDLVINNIISWFEGKGALTPVPETAKQKTSFCEQKEAKKLY